MPEFTILDFGTAEKTAERLTAGASLAVDTTEAIEEIVVDLFRVEAAVFSSQGRRGGGSWKRLKPKTVKAKGSITILHGSQREGYGGEYGGQNRLMKSVTEPDAQFQILETGRTSIVFGTDRPGAAAQQYGYAPKGIPARPFMRYTPADMARWNDILYRHLMKVFVNA